MRVLVDPTQEIRWKLFLFSGTFQYQLDIAHDFDENTVIFKMIASTFMSDCVGTWKLTPATLDEGVSPATQDPSTLIKHTLAVRVAGNLPDVVTKNVAPIFQEQVHTVMEDLMREIQKQEMARRELARSEALLQTANPVSVDA